MTLSVSPIAAALSPSLELTDIATISCVGGPFKPESTLINDTEDAPQDGTEDDIDVAVDDAESGKENSESGVASANQGETCAADSSPAQSKKHVRFDIADVLEFEPSVWTSTVSSDGIPVGMSSTLRRRTRRRLDSFESERCLWRVRREEFMEHGYLEPDERLEILENAGHAMSVISHVEKETIRINRERWESNEYDLMHQYGLGEVPVMEMSDDDDDDDEMLFLVQPDSSDEDCGLMQVDDDDADGDADDDARDCASVSNQDEGFYYSARNVLVDAEVRFAMEEMDAYDTRCYEELTVDYAMDCILGDDDASSNADETNELPYAKDSFESPLGFALSEMSSSPTDVSSSTDCLIAACAARSKAAAAAAANSGDAKMLRI